MELRDNDTKKRIIKVTIDMILKGNIDKITTRSIAKELGVGSALVNYHFQTKENLINIALDTFFQDQLQMGQMNLNEINLPAKDKIGFSIKGYASFLAAYPDISRAYILNYMMRNAFDDSGEKVLESLLPLAGEIAGGRNEDELAADLLIVIGSVQMVFLHSDEFKKYTGIDFYDDSARNRHIDRLVDRFFT